MIEYEDLGASNRQFFEDYRSAFREVLESGWYILGDAVRAFEKDFAAYLGARHCAGVASGLDGLILALDALDLPKGSEVLVPSNTYIATIMAIVRCGHRPVLVEPDIRTYNIDPEQMRRSITPNTRAAMIVHLYGKPCAMDPIMDVVKEAKLRLIEDCAQSHGATYKGRQTGTFGDVNAFSFYPTKNLGGLGDGGAIVTDNEKLAGKVRELRNYGSTVKYKNESLGYNSRLDEVQAAFLSVKLRALDRINEHKRSLAGLYRKGLKGSFVLPAEEPDTADVYHIFTIRHPERDKLREYLLGQGIKTEIHYPIPPHRQQALQDLDLGSDFPVSEEIHATTLSLPISFAHTPDDIGHVIRTLNSF